MPARSRASVEQSGAGGVHLLHARAAPALAAELDRGEVTQGKNSHKKLLIFGQEHSISRGWGFKGLLEGFFLARLSSSSRARRSQARPKRRYVGNFDTHRIEYSCARRYANRNSAHLIPSAQRTRRTLSRTSRSVLVVECAHAPLLSCSPAHMRRAVTATSSASSRIRSGVSFSTAITNSWYSSPTTPRA